MGHITLCSDHKNMPLLTSYGQLHFDENGECKLDSDIARQVLAKYKPTIWAKKSGKPEPVKVEAPTQKPVKVEKTPENNFGFPDNVHVSKAARAALANGNLTPDEVLAQRDKVLNVSEPPKRSLDDDLVEAGAAATDRSGNTLKPVKKAASEDSSDDVPVKKSKSAKSSGKKGR